MAIFVSEQLQGAAEVLWTDKQRVTVNDFSPQRAQAPPLPNPERWPTLREAVEDIVDKRRHEPFLDQKRPFIRQGDVIYDWAVIVTAYKDLYPDNPKPHGV
jgi:hypothetical protein